jgi:acetyltransferase
MNNPIPPDFRLSFPLKDSSLSTIRPISPNDAQIEWDFVHTLTTQSKHYRFMGGVKDLTQKELEYFTNIDFKKDMALIATVCPPNQNEKEIAVGRGDTLASMELETVSSQSL